MSYVNLNSIQQSPKNREVMIIKLFSASELLKNHVIHCTENICKTCRKIGVWADIFIKYEKETNKSLDVKNIVDDDFVEKVIFRNEIMDLL